MIVFPGLDVRSLVAAFVTASGAHVNDIYRLL